MMNPSLMYVPRRRVEIGLCNCFHPEYNVTIANV